MHRIPQQHPIHPHNKELTTKLNGKEKSLEENLVLVEATRRKLETMKMRLAEANEDLAKTETAGVSEVPQIEEFAFNLKKKENAIKKEIVTLDAELNKIEEEFCCVQKEREEIKKISRDQHFKIIQMTQEINQKVLETL